MAESIIFQCDMCATKSDEEPAAYPRRDRCRVELVFRGQRFILPPPELPPVPASADLGPVGGGFPPSAIPGIIPLGPGMVAGSAPWPPVIPPGMAWPGPMAAAVAASPEDPNAPAPDEDDRVLYTICDKCMKRVCAFFDLKVETFEEYSVRTAREAEVSKRASNPIPSGGGMRAEMVGQWPTRTREPGHGPGPGGLVDQYPTPGAPQPPPEVMAAIDASAAPVSVTEQPKKDAPPGVAKFEKSPDPPAAE